MQFQLLPSQDLVNPTKIDFSEKTSICKVNDTLYFLCGGYNSDLAATIDTRDRRLVYSLKAPVPDKVYGHQIVCYNETNIFLFGGRNTTYSNVVRRYNMITVRTSFLILIFRTLGTWCPQWKKLDATSGRCSTFSTRKFLFLEDQTQPRVYQT